MSVVFFFLGSFSGKELSILKPAKGKEDHVKVYQRDGEGQTPRQSYVTWNTQKASRGARWVLAQGIHRQDEHYLLQDGLSLAHS